MKNKMVAIMCLIAAAFVLIIIAFPAGSGHYWAVLPLVMLLIALVLCIDCVMS